MWFWVLGLLVGLAVSLAFGQLSPVEQVEQPAEVAAADLSADEPAASPDVVSVSAGGSHSCALDVEGGVVCWGANGEGQLDAPEGVYASVSAGETHTCAIDVDGALLCWGSAEFGKASAPTGRFTRVSAGEDHTCAVREDGAIVCFGWDRYGQSSPPAGEWLDVGVGEDHSCGLRADGAIVCWGDNSWGQLAAPTGVFAALTVGDDHSCALSEAGRVVCWGFDQRGQLWPPEGLEAVQISAGFDSACALTAVGGGVRCWGALEEPPAEVQALGFAMVDLGHEHGCGVTVERRVYCWPASPTAVPERVGGGG